MVVLSYQGSKVDRIPARQVPDIDLIVGAHSHDEIAPPERIGKVRLVQTAGLRWIVDLTRPIGQRIRDVAVGDVPLDPGRSYWVVTHSGMLQGIHRYTTFAEGRDIERTEDKVTDVVEVGLRAMGTLRAPALGAVTLIKDET